MVLSSTLSLFGSMAIHRETLLITERERDHTVHLTRIDSEDSLKLSAHLRSDTQSRGVQTPEQSEKPGYTRNNSTANSSMHKGQNHAESAFARKEGI
jgi:hypothetical protein